MNNLGFLNMFRNQKNSSITASDRPLPPETTTGEEEDAVLYEYARIARPINIDHGTKIRVGSNVFVNFDCTVLDTCTVSIGSCTILGRNVSFSSASHPVDSVLRNGTNGLEFGGLITVGDDCWVGRNVTILPVVTIGDEYTFGTGSVVIKVCSIVPSFSSSFGGQRSVE
jgi:acetyltransferase-like isoleucine patch superfamily enzyme